MAYRSNLTGFTIIEKDKNADVLVTWVYPSIEDKLRTVVLNRSGLNGPTIPLQFSYSKFRSTWIYAFASQVAAKHEEEEAEEDSPLPNVKAFSIVLFSSDFNPEMYGALGSLLSKVYAASGTTIRVLEGYLSVFTRGMLKIDDTPEGLFKASKHDFKRALIVTSIKDVIKNVWHTNHSVVDSPHDEKKSCGVL